MKKEYISPKLEKITIADVIVTSSPNETDFGLPEVDVSKLDS